MKFLVSLLLLFFLSGIHDSAINAQKERPSLSFVILTDLHVSPGTASDSDLNKIVDEINGTETEFTIVTGDLSNSGSDAELRAVKSALDRLKKPCYVIPGNHDTNWSESAGLLVNDLWGNDRFVFTQGGFRLIGFSTGPFMKMGDGHVKGEDIAWLKRQLASNDGLIPLAFSHYPLNEGLDDWQDVTDVLKRAGCRAVFCGHGHTLRLYNFDGIPGIMCRSVILGKSTVPGYNIINVSSDSVFVYNKIIGTNLSEPSIRFSYVKPDIIEGLPVSPRPDFSVNNSYKNIRVGMEITDTASIFSGPCIVGERIICGNSLGYLKAFSTSTGEMIWQTKIAGPVYSTPASWKDIIALGTVDGKIIGVSTADGRILWEVKTGRPVLAEGIVSDGSIYIGGGDREFFRIDMRSGKVLWRYSDVNGLVQGRAAISGNSVMFGAWDKYFYCLDKKSGALRWKWTNGKPQVLYSAGNIYPVCSGDKVFIVAPDRYMTAIDVKTGTEIWRTNRHHVRESMGVSPEGSVVYAKLMTDTIIAVSARENRFRTIWKGNAGFGYEHTPCPLLADDKQVVASTREGTIVAVDPVTSGVKWKYKAGNSAINRMVKDMNGNLWLTMMEGKILGLRENK